MTNPPTNTQSFREAAKTVLNDFRASIDDGADWAAYGPAADRLGALHEQLVNQKVEVAYDEGYEDGVARGMEIKARKEGAE